jgi:hypothetical protein
MRNLKKKLKEDLKYYSLSAKLNSAEDILEDCGIDYEMNMVALKRERLEKYKHLLTPEELAVLEEADKNFLATWEKVKNVEPKTPYNRIAKAFLEDIVKITQRQPAQTTA